MKNIKVAAALCFLSWFYSCGPDTSSNKSIVFRGIVLSKFRDQACFGSIIIKNDHLIDTIHNLCNCTSERSDVWNYVIKGDIIYKEKDSLIINVLRMNSLKRFEYPSCYK